MTIAELIDLLTLAADDLPDGLEAEVHLHLCRGGDLFQIVTREVTVDTDSDVVLVQGHPHLDADSTVRRPVTMGVDDELRRIVDDPAARPEATPGTVIVQIGEERAYRLPLRADGKILAPGELDALRVGCLCDPQRNERARDTTDRAGNVRLIIKDDCPVHQTVTPPL